MKTNSLVVLLVLTAGLSQPAPTGLMCDMLAGDKVVIRDATPEFSWVVPAQMNGRQQAYQILVASSLDSLIADKGDVWDSGKVNSDISVHVEYAGKPVAPNSTYFWKVRIWDAASARPFSKPHSFQSAADLKDYATSYHALQQRVVQPVRFVQKAPGIYFVDFGKAAFGTVNILFPQPCSEDSIIVHLGETLKDSTTIDRNPGGTIRYRKIKSVLSPGSQNSVIQIPPDKRNTGPQAILMPPEIGEVLPFRYCEIETPMTLTEKSVQQIAVNYPFDDAAAFFKSSDSLLNEVWELCKYSIKATSFCGIYVDGDRERIPYEADAYINQLCHYGVDREHSMARRSHEYLLFKPTWPTEWILHSVLMAWADFLYTGNSESLRHYYDDLKAKTLMALAREDGLISTQTGLVTETVLNSIHFDGKLRDIVDWPPGSFALQGTGERDGYKMGKINTVVNAFHFRAIDIMSRVAELLGHDEDAQLFAERADLVKRSINQKLFDAERAVYIDCEDSTHSALHANMFPLAFGIVPEEQVPFVVEFIKSRGMACSVYGAQYLLEALYESGEAQYALDLMTAPHDRSWPNMMELGSTITLEAWDLKYKKNLDWNHAWGAAPANIIPRYVVGVQPLSPGFKTIKIKPQIGNLEFIRAQVPTIRGPVSVVVEQNKNEYRLQVDIPGNSTALVVLPRFQNESNLISMDGKQVKGMVRDQFIFVESVPSGSHTFVRQKESE